MPSSESPIVFAYSPLFPDSAIVLLSQEIIQSLGCDSETYAEAVNAAEPRVCVEISVSKPGEILAGPVSVALRPINPAPENVGLHQTALRVVLSRSKVLGRANLMTFVPLPKAVDWPIRYLAINTVERIPTEAGNVASLLTHTHELLRGCIAEVKRKRSARDN